MFLTLREMNVSTCRSCKQPGGGGDFPKEDIQVAAVCGGLDAKADVQRETRWRRQIGCGVLDEAEDWLAPPTRLGLRYLEGLCRSLAESEILVEERITRRCNVFWLAIRSDTE